MLVFAGIVEIVLIGLVIWAVRWDPKFEMHPDDARLPIGIAISAWRANRQREPGTGYFTGMAVLKGVVVVCLVGCAIAWPIYAVAGLPL